MATESRGIRFSKSEITLDENGDFIVTEYKKDDTIVTNLSNKIREFIGLEGVDISFGQKSETESEE
ncbi:hypothetical protein [Clostridium perfringens]|uniref:hypothetical protein n=1 Tax=Clostridium perfringens TaxID=1502 RepID=UPI00096AAD29|nr:hypothetical protein [Clostridium perfringens]